MITAFEGNILKKKICRILFAFSETCNFFFFLIFQNQSAAGDVIQQIKIKKPNMLSNAVVLDNALYLLT